MRIFVTRIPAPEPSHPTATKWQIVVERDNMQRVTFDPEAVTLLGAWTFDCEEGATPTVWLVPANEHAIVLIDGVEFRP